MTAASEQTPRETREFVTLNGMRGVASLAVVFFHGATLFGAIVPSGFLAVDFFFALSGFIIAHAYQDRLSKNLGLWTFAKIRLVRFYPLYFAGLLFGIFNEVLLIASHNAYQLSLPTLLVTGAMALFFLPWPLPARDNNMFPINTPSWSLLNELLINILYAALLPLLRPGVLLAVLLVSVALLVWAAPAEGLGHVGVTSDTLLAGAMRTLAPFTLGLLIHRLPRSRVRLPVGLLLLLLAGCFLVRGPLLYQLFFALIVSPLLVLLGAAVEPKRVTKRVAETLGLISFPIYALHYPTIALAKRIANAAHLSPPIIGAVAVAGLLFVCATYAIRYDIAARRWLTDLLGQLPQRDRAEVAAP